MKCWQKHVGYCVAVLASLVHHTINAQCPSNNTTNCPSFARYEQTSNMPAATKVVDYIEALNNANVLNGQSVTFEAGNRITLGNGLQALSGSNFVARIRPCTFNAASVSICSEQIGQSCNPTILNMTAVVSGGSGNFSYSWSNSLGTSRTVQTTISGSVTYTVTVTDIGTGQIYTASKTIQDSYPPSNVFGGFAVNQNINAFFRTTAWYVRSTAPNPNQAFNANYASISIYDRWGGLIVRETRSGYFKDSDLAWYGLGGSCPNTYYWILELSNCSGSQNFSGSVTMVCNSRLAESDSLAMEDAPAGLDNGSIPFTEHVSPNPISSGFLHFGRNVSIYSLTNSTGVLIQQGSNANKLDVTGLPKGVYMLRLDEKTEKVIVQ